MLGRNVGVEDWIDVANLAMFLHFRQYEMVRVLKTKVEDDQ